MDTGQLINIDVCQKISSYVDGDQGEGLVCSELLVLAQLANVVRQNIINKLWQGELLLIPIMPIGILAP